MSEKKSLVNKDFSFVPQSDRLLTIEILSIGQDNLIFVQGPVEVAVVFLKDSPENKSQDVRHRNKLRLSFKDFLKKYVQVTDVDNYH